MGSGGFCRGRWGWGRPFWEVGGRWGFKELVREGFERVGRGVYIFLVVFVKMVRGGMEGGSPDLGDAGEGG